MCTRVGYSKPQQTRAYAPAGGGSHACAYKLKYKCLFVRVLGDENDTGWVMRMTIAGCTCLDTPATLLTYVIVQLRICRTKRSVK
eukprot:5393651-Pleurochrysis_carterae.AAC.1